DLRAIEWRAVFRIHAHIAGIVPPAAQNVPPGANGVPSPFADIASHIVRANRTDSGIAANPGRAIPAEVAELCHQSVTEAAAARAIPLVGRRQALTRKFGIRRGFIPAHAIHRKLIPTLWVCAELPAGRSRTAGCVSEFRHGLFEG